MSIQEWGAIGELVGGAAVLVTLVYLALQVRQTQHFMRAQAYQDRLVSIMDLSMRVAESQSLSRTRPVGNWSIIRDAVRIT